MRGRSWFGDQLLATSFAAAVGRLGGVAAVSWVDHPGYLTGEVGDWCVSWEVSDEWLPALVGASVASRMLAARGQAGLPGLADHEGVTDGHD